MIWRDRLLLSQTLDTGIRNLRIDIGQNTEQSLQSWKPLVLAIQAIFNRTDFVMAFVYVYLTLILPCTCQAENPTNLIMALKTLIIVQTPVLSNI